jgi:hypothetical protein
MPATVFTARAKARASQSCGRTRAAVSVYFEETNEQEWFAPHLVLRTKS